jgi:hypothetical protein
VRLGIRSTALIEYKRETSRKIRLHNKLPPFTPIPTRVFILYVLRDRKLYLAVIKSFWGPFGSVLLATVVLGSLMLPIIFLWVRNKGMDVGYKSTLTVVFFVLISAILFPIMKGPLQRSLEKALHVREGHVADRLQTLRRGSPLSTGNRDDALSNASSERHMERSRRRNRFWVKLAKMIGGRPVRNESENEAHDADFSHPSSAGASNQPMATRLKRWLSPTRRRQKPTRSNSLNSVEAREVVARWRDATDSISRPEPSEAFPEPLERGTLSRNVTYEVEVMEQSFLGEADADPDPVTIPLPQSSAGSFEVATIDSGTGHRRSWETEIEPGIAQSLGASTSQDQMSAPVTGQHKSNKMPEGLSQTMPTPNTTDFGIDTLSRSGPSKFATKQPSDPQGVTTFAEYTGENPNQRRESDDVRNCISCLRGSLQCSKDIPTCDYCAANDLVCTYPPYQRLYK